MKRRHSLVRLGLAAALLGSLAACTIVPAQPAAYRAPPVYVETYPVYRYDYPHSHSYDEHHEHRHHGDRDARHRYDNRRHDSPLAGAARSHREIRRSLGLPRLPGMP